MPAAVSAADTLADVTAARIADVIHRLRDELLDTTPRICVERARLVTQAYQTHQADPPVLRRARALAHVLDHMTIFIREGELVVGNQASHIRAAPIFPEYSVDWIEPELDEFATRPADRYLISGEAKAELIDDILPYWKGRTLYDRAMATLPEEALLAQELSLIHI